MPKPKETWRPGVPEATPHDCNCCGESCLCFDGVASKGESCEMCWACNMADCPEGGDMRTCERKILRREY